MENAQKAEPEVTRTRSDDSGQSSGTSQPASTLDDPKPSPKCECPPGCVGLPCCG